MGETSSRIRVYSTTILCLKRGEEVVMAGDGQVTFQDTIIKETATKIRKLYDGKVLAGFAGATADAFTLLERFEEKLRTYGGNLLRSAVELAKDWRTDKVLRRLEALMIVADKTQMLLVSGTGDVLQPEEDILAIGSGGNYAYAAALALMKNTQLSLKEIAEEALKIAARICIYTNSHIQMEVL